MRRPRHADSAVRRSAARFRACLSAAISASACSRASCVFVAARVWSRSIAASQSCSSASTASANDVASSAISEASRFSAIAMSISSCRNCSSTASAFSRTACPGRRFLLTQPVEPVLETRSRLSRAAVGTGLQLVDVPADLRQHVVDRLRRHAYLLSSSDVIPTTSFSWATANALPRTHAVAATRGGGEERTALMRGYGVRAVSAPRRHGRSLSVGLPEVVEAGPGGRARVFREREEQALASSVRPRLVGPLEHVCGRAPRRCRRHRRRPGRAPAGRARAPRPTATVPPPRRRAPGARALRPCAGLRSRTRSSRARPARRQRGRRTLPGPRARTRADTPPLRRSSLRCSATQASSSIAGT